VASCEEKKQQQQLLCTYMCTDNGIQQLLANSAFHPSGVGK